MSKSRNTYLFFSNPFLSTKLTKASKSQKIDSKLMTKTKTKTFQNLNMPPPLVKLSTTYVD